MKQVVIMPGGFHPFHAGHYALYQQTKKAFPGADVYVAATDDTSNRPFPFALKEKLATLAGVEPGHFVRVKSPFSAEEITSRYDPETTNLIFVKSEKNAKTGPSPEGPFPAEIDPATGKLPLVTRGPRKGLPVSDRLQYYRKGMKLAPMSRHSYLAYLPTVEFGSGMTSGSEIRAAWPTMDQQGKINLVMSLYPKTKSNPQLAATVAKMLDVAIVGKDTSNADSTVTEDINPKIDLTPNFPNYDRLIGEFVGARNNKLLFQIVAAELKPGVKPTDKIVKSMASQKPIAMAPNYVKNRQVVPENEDEYAPPGLNAAQVKHLMTQLRGKQPFVWLRPSQINGSHSEKELLSLGFKKSRYNTWGGTDQMWKRLSGIEESRDYVEEKISR